MPVLSLEVKKAVQAGAAKDVLAWQAIKTVQVTGGAFNATLQLQGSNDGTNWDELCDDITAVGFYTFTAVVEQIRVNTSAYVAGDPLVTLAGHYEPGR